MTARAGRDGAAYGICGDDPSLGPRPRRVLQLDQRSGEGGMRVGHTARTGASTAPEVRLHDFGLYLLGCESRAAVYHVALTGEVARRLGTLGPPERPR